MRRSVIRRSEWFLGDRVVFLGRRWAAGSLAACTLLGVITLTTPQAAADDAAELLQSALSAELAGNDAERDELIHAAQAADPTDDAAYWQEGLVKFEGKWRTPEEVAVAVRRDKDRREYRLLREEMRDSLADHEALADWCQQHELLAEERFHRMAVLWKEPTNAYAQKRLGLRPFRGSLYTTEEIAAMADREKRSQANLRKYGKQFEGWLTEALTCGDVGRLAILEKFRAVNSPDAIEALQAAGEFEPSYQRRLERKIGEEESREYLREICLNIVAAVRAMPEHEATVFLAETAVFANDPPLRAAASLALRERRPTDYMPMMMSAMESLVDADIDVSVAADGTVNYVALYRQEGAELDRAHLDLGQYVTATAPGRNGLISRRFVPTVYAQVSRAQNQAAWAKYQIQVDNIERQKMNDRVTDALRMITDEDLGRDPAVWRQEWADFNDIYYPEERPVQTTQARQFQYTYVPPPLTGMSCFAVGTPVWTNRGPERIETIVPGDLVLSQNPLTGELDYRPVIQTTVRPPTKFVELQLPEGDRITSTRGHRFWVDGEGWCMAKFLRPKLRLHAVGGALTLTAAEELDGAEAYNLVVDGFHTYFVGESKLLVHDNSCPQPTLAPIPGMDAQRGPTTLAKDF